MNANMVLKELAENLRECVSAKKEHNLQVKKLFDRKMTSSSRTNLELLYQLMCDNVTELENILYDVEICEEEFCVEPEAKTFEVSGNVVYLTKKM